MERTKKKTTRELKMDPASIRRREHARKKRDFEKWKKKIKELHCEYQPRADYAVHVYEMKAVLYEMMHYLYHNKNIIL